MKEFIITKNDANQRLDKFITKACPTLPTALMFKYIRTKRIKVNGKRAEISTRLNVGDVVDMYINDEFFEKSETRYDFMGASKNLSIVYEDENIMLLDKRPGVSVHEDESGSTNTLAKYLRIFISFSPIYAYNNYK